MVIMQLLLLRITIKWEQKQTKNKNSLTDARTNGTHLVLTYTIIIFLEPNLIIEYQKNDFCAAEII